MNAQNSSEIHSAEICVTVNCRKITAITSAQKYMILRISIQSSFVDFLAALYPIGVLLISGARNKYFQYLLSRQSALFVCIGR